MKKMKEQTYGWYPSVRDIYLSKNQPTPYHLECLYKFRESGYHNPIVEPPEPAFVIRGITPTPSPPPSRPATSRASTRCGAHSATRRPKSVPVPKFRPVPKMNIPTPMQAWGKTTLAETEWGYGYGSPAATPQPPAVEESADEKGEMTVKWPKQHMVGKYDKPFVPTTTAQTQAEEVFGTPLPPRETDMGGDSGYVFIPTGDGGVEIHSPPPIYWPEPNPIPPTPPRSASSKASMGSSGGIADRKKLQEQYRLQVQKEQEEKRKQVERQRRFEKLLRQQQQQQLKQQQQQQQQVAKSASGTARERVKSATTHRAKPPIPQRPVFSARPSSDTKVYAQTPRHQGKIPTPSNAPLYPQTARTPSTAQLELDRACEAEADKRSALQRPMNPMPPSSTSPHAPACPLPPSPSYEDLMIMEDRSPSPDYMETVDKYGWRAQVHGDPYNIKKTTKRLPYTVKCPEPTLAPEPPKVHMECKETFFYNTIPRRKVGFDVHQEMLSESLHAKRIELQKRDGLNYRYKTFSFAY